MRILASAPHFLVADLRRSIRFYVEILGFEQPRLWGDPPAFAMPSRDGFVVMLNQAGPDHIRTNGSRKHWDAYFWCEQLDAFWQSVRDKVDVVHGPVDRALYGMREIGLRDPDGYMLVFAEDLAKNKE